MKKIIVFVVLSLSTTLFSHAQIIEWGLKGGLNFNSNGDLTNEIINISETTTIKSNNSTGFHIGAFAKTKGSLYVRPEIIYTQTQSDYDSEGSFKMKKIDMPILAGVKVFSILNIFAGPSLQYIIDTDLDGFNISDVENDFTVGLNVGVGVQLGNLGVDLRYERGLSDNEAAIFNNTDFEGKIDTRPEQIILSLSVKM
ncbi:porin family protein [Urechidicola vernalis]|uniref:Porin family protein n=1 Tax=Urechidicola vernalis TaxID=3075600 RepID=A0ABU2Y0N7_9FLAO|nr:porin family protein [Urechidicola sp. P050]MDT0551671.1 porin family protein [Urechidicola sp. P050]